MRFLVDARLPPVLARWLTERGHDARHVADLELERAADGAIWSRAVDDGAAIVTKDEDFATRRAMTVSGPAIIWVRFGNTTNPTLLRLMDAHLAHIIAALARDEVVEVS